MPPRRGPAKLSGRTRVDGRWLNQHAQAEDQAGHDEPTTIGEGFFDKHQPHRTTTALGPSILAVPNPDHDHHRSRTAKQRQRRPGRCSGVFRIQSMTTYPIRKYKWSAVARPERQAMGMAVSATTTPFAEEDYANAS
jgi:hypothetical protein